LAIILGKRIKNANQEDAAKAIWGVTLFADWSARDFAPNAMNLNFARGKNFDNCYSLGPCIVVDELDAFNAPVETFVNNEKRQSFNTSDMALRTRSCPLCSLSDSRANERITGQLVKPCCA
jgi:acylpyruvate hydrolase